MWTCSNNPLSIPNEAVVKCSRDISRLSAFIFFNLPCKRLFLSSNARYRVSHCVAVKSHSLPPVEMARHISRVSHDLPIFGLPAKMKMPWGRIFSMANCSGSYSYAMREFPSMVVNTFGLATVCGVAEAAAWFC